MAITVTERLMSRPVQKGANPSLSLLFDITGTSDETEANAALLTQSSLYWPAGGGIGALVRCSWGVRPTGYEQWEGEVRYDRKGIKDTGDSSITFDTGGGTKHVTQSINTRGRYAPSGKSAPNYKCAIGVTKDSVEGVDIIVPTFQWTETHYIAAASMTWSYISTLYALTGKINASSFRVFAAGEVLFLGASAQQRGFGDWEISFKFAASPNATNLTIGDITVAEKYGWDYLWVRYKDTDDATANARIKVPEHACVEQVYQTANFSLLGI